MLLPTVLAGGDEKAGLISLLVSPVAEREVEIIALIVVVLVAVDFLWELSTDILEHLLIHYNHEHIHAMLEKLYKELTIVGIWAIVLFVITQYVPADSAGLKHFFELVHVSLFGLTLFYILTCVFIAFVSEGIFMLWAHFESVGPHRSNAAFKEARSDRRLIRYLMPWYWVRLLYTEVQYHYFEIRYHFRSSYELDTDFPFHKYLEVCVKHLYTELAQVHWSVLAIVLVVQLTVWIAITTVTNNNIGVAYTVLGAIALCGQFVLWLKIYEVFATVAHEGHDVLQISASQAAVTIDQRRIAAEDGFDVEGEHLQQLELNREMDVIRERRSMDGQRGTGDVVVVVDPPEHPLPFLQRLRKGGMRVKEALTSDPHLPPQTPDHFKPVGRRASRSAFDTPGRRGSMVRPINSVPFLAQSDTSSSSEEDDESWESYISSSSWVTYGDSDNEATSGDVDGEPGHYVHHHHHHVHHHHHHEHDPHHRHHRHPKRQRLHHHTQIDLIFITGFLLPLLQGKISPRDVWRFFTVATPHQRLFWLSAPGLYLYLVQLMLFYNVSFVVWVVVAVIKVIDIAWIYEPLALFTICINFGFFIPVIIYKYSLIMNVGEYSKDRLIAVVMAEQHKKEKKKKGHNYHHRKHPITKAQSDAADGTSVGEPSGPHASEGATPRTSVDLPQAAVLAADSGRGELPPEEGGRRYFANSTVLQSSVNVSVDGAALRDTASHADASAAPRRSSKDRDDRERDRDYYMPFAPGKGRSPSKERIGRGRSVSKERDDRGRSKERMDREGRGRSKERKQSRSGSKGHDGSRSRSGSKERSTSPFSPRQNTGLPLRSLRSSSKERQERQERDLSPRVIYVASGELSPRGAKDDAHVWGPPRGSLDSVRRSTSKEYAYARGRSKERKKRARSKSHKVGEERDRSKDSLSRSRSRSRSRSFSGSPRAPVRRSFDDDRSALRVARGGHLESSDEEESGGFSLAASSTAALPPRDWEAEEFESGSDSEMSDGGTHRRRPRHVHRLPPSDMSSSLEVQRQRHHHHHHMHHHH